MAERTGTSVHDIWRATRHVVSLLDTTVRDIVLAGSAASRVVAEPRAADDFRLGDVDLQVVVSRSAALEPSVLTALGIPLAARDHLHMYDLIATKIQMGKLLVSVHVIPLSTYVRLCDIRSATIRVFRTTIGRAAFNYIGFWESRVVDWSYVARFGGYELIYEKTPVVNEAFFLEPWQDMALTGLELLVSRETHDARSDLLNRVVQSARDEGVTTPAQFLQLFRYGNRPLPAVIQARLEHAFSMPRPTGRGSFVGCPEHRG
jgi:hypothetical protein